MFWFYFAIGLLAVFGLVGVAVGAYIGKEEGSLGLSVLFAGFGGALGLVVGSLAAIAPLTYAQTHYKERTVEAKVLDKDRTREGDMRVYTDKGVFLNADSVWRGKHNSADWWGKWEEGKTYRFDVAGWRLGVTSDFPNIFGWAAVK